jgi:ABC-type cobalamin transport system ATPase subunit
MAQVQGLVQRVKVTTGLVLAWAYIGPTPDNTTLLIVMQNSSDPIDVAAQATMAEALSSAAASGKQVIATHADGKAAIDFVQILLA